MTTGAAKKFILRAREEKSFRTALNKAANSEERDAILHEADFEFTEMEFEEGFSNLFAQCVRQDQAQEVEQIYLWWKMIRKT